MKKLIFVYNADSGFFNSMSDSIIKIFMPSKAKCKLCTLTYGVFSMKEEWEEFIKKSKVDFEFLHKDEFIKKYGKKESFPAVFDEKLNKIIKPKEINSIQTLEELISLISMRI